MHLYFPLEEFLFICQYMNLIEARGAPLRSTMPPEPGGDEESLGGASVGVAGFLTNMVAALPCSVNRPTEGCVVMPS
ncbi:hypothetical protein KC19_1G058600 [Ceratodon purpureus]|uniref:Uncharacterized protein n=1 Tax=Ceratodon purpureus TaxID=3225 RepID=A0A8T0J579_CERPU|nr:hypothetical protein KC19_1G058600 [Ceratodon purpureus]